MQLSATPAPRSRIVLELEFEANEVVAALTDGRPAIDSPGDRSKALSGLDADDHLASAPPAIQSLIARSIWDALQLLTIRPLADPAARVLSAGPGRPMVVQSEVQVLPEVALGRYWELDEGPTIEPITETDVDAEIDRLRRTEATVREILARTPENGEIMLIAVRGERGGTAVPSVNADALEVVAGRDLLVPGLMDALLAMQPGDQREFDLAFPDDWEGEAAGSTVHFTVVLRHLRRVVLPEVDVAFANRHGALSVPELRKLVQDRLEAEGRDRARHALADRLLDHAIATCELLVPGQMTVGAARRGSQGLPDVLVRKQQELVAASVGAGDPATTLALDASDLATVARAQTMAMLVLTAMAGAEGIEIDDRLVRTAIDAATADAPGDSELAEYLQSDHGRAFVRNMLARRAAIERAVDRWLESHPTAPALPHLHRDHLRLDQAILHGASRTHFTDPVV